MALYNIKRISYCIYLHRCGYCYHTPASHILKFSQSHPAVMVTSSVCLRSPSWPCLSFHRSASCAESSSQPSMMPISNRCQFRLDASMSHGRNQRSATSSVIMPAGFSRQPFGTKRCERRNLRRPRYSFCRSSKIASYIPQCLSPIADGWLAPVP